MEILSPEIFYDYFRFVALVGGRYLILGIGSYFLIWVIFKKQTQRFKIVRSELPKGQLIRELKYSFLAVLIFAVGGVVNSLINKNGWGLYYQDIHEYGWGYWVLTVFAMIGLNDIHFYGIHRLLHWPPLYKRYHAVHHMSRQTTPLTSNSFHGVETFLTMTIVFAYPFLFPLHLSAYITFTTLAFLNNIYGHCGFEFWPRKWINVAPIKWLNTSSVHSWHHEKVHGNYGLYFTFLDRMFGTYKKPFSD